jgi:amino acid transporter
MSDGAKPVRDAITVALRYWEPRRLPFNGVLFAVVAICFMIGWPASRQVLNFDSILGLFVLAVLANVAYCAAYIPDIVIQQSELREKWLRWRWLLLWVGTLFAAAITYFLTWGILANVPPTTTG